MLKQSGWKSIFQFLGGIIVSAVILIWLIRSTAQGAEGFEWQDAAAIARGISIWVVLATLACQLIQTWFRTIRYRLFLRHGEIEPDFGKLLAITFARNMFVDMLPSRLGEVSYLILLKRMLGERVARGVASMGASFAFDLVALLILILVVITTGAIMGSGGWHASLVISVAAIVLIAYYVFFYGFSLAMRLSSDLRKKLLGKGMLRGFNGIAEETDAAIVMIRSQRDLGKVFFLSLGIRVFKYAGVLVLLWAILNTAFLTVELKNLGSLFFGIVVGEASASMPIPTFMSFGTYEAGASLTLQNLGYTMQASVISIFLTHLISQSIDYSLGIAALCLSWLQGWFGETERTRSLLKRISMGLLFILLTAFSATIYFWNRKEQVTDNSPAEVTDYQAQKVETEVPVMDAPVSEEPLPVASEPAAPRGFAVWSSNRFGNHEIVQLDLQSRQLKRLTDTPYKEYYPSISPDGKRIVFARSVKENWSFRHLSGWDIVMLDLETGEETLLAKEGFHPTWAGDNSHVLFSRNGKQILMLNLETGREELLLEAGKGRIPSGYEFLTPSYNPIQKSVAVTIRGSRRTKFIFGLDGQDPIELPQGCQLTWMPDYRELIFTGAGANKFNAFHLVDPETRATRELLDMPGDYSHEYFPRVSDDGQWLIFGASAEGHEHDEADYEIFLWRIGSGIDTVERLSYDPGNDSWPDIHIFP